MKSQTVTLGQQKDLASALVQGIPEDLPCSDAQYWIGHKKELHEILDGILRRTSKEVLTKQGISAYPLIETFPLTVKYGKTDEQIDAGKYGTKEENICAKNFPTDKTGEAELEAELVHFDNWMTTEQVIGEIDKLGLRSGNLDELLAFGVKYPHLQRDFRIFALGSNGHYIPFLGNDGWNRVLISKRLDDEEADVRFSRFLAFRK